MGAGPIIAAATLASSIPALLRMGMPPLVIWFVAGFAGVLFIAGVALTVVARGFRELREYTEGQ
jgi:hypothetical protein